MCIAHQISCLHLHHLLFDEFTVDVKKEEKEKSEKEEKEDFEKIDDEGSEEKLILSG